MLEKLALVIPGDETLEPVNGMPSNGFSDLTNLISWGTTMLMIVASLLCLALLVYAGIQWIMSGGEKQAVESARKRLIYAIAGLIIVFLSFMIVKIVGDFFNVPLVPY